MKVGSGNIYHPSSVRSQSSLWEITAKTRLFWRSWLVSEAVTKVASRTTLALSGDLSRSLTKDIAGMPMYGSLVVWTKERGHQAPLRIVVTYTSPLMGTLGSRESCNLILFSNLTFASTFIDYTISYIVCSGREIRHQANIFLNCFFSLSLFSFRCCLILESSPWMAASSGTKWLASRRSCSAFSSSLSCTWANARRYNAFAKRAFNRYYVFDV